MLISLNLTSFHYQVISDIAYEIQKANTQSTIYYGKENNTKNGVTVLGSNYWLWIPKYIFDKNNNNEFRNYYSGQDNTTKKIILVAGENFIRDMTRDNHTAYNIEKLKSVFVQSYLLKAIIDNQSNIMQNNNTYPFNSLKSLDQNPSPKIKYAFIENT
jgi:hypothetical protein